MMTELRTIEVALGERSYEIRIGRGLIAKAGTHLAPLLGAHGIAAEVVVVTDRNVAEHHLAALEESLRASGISQRTIILEPGEQSKDFAHLARLMDDLIGGGLNRDAMVVALGGGVVGDLTGFAAAIALRGVDFVQIPTTLLSQVDSSVGGKTGINTAHGKNLVGAFHQPRMVLADVSALETLPRRELLAGYAEIVKYGLIRDAGFFGWLEEHGAALIEGDVAARMEAVARSCRAKAEVVAADEVEHGERALLNLGHTFGHAMETEIGFSDRLLHGEAVAIGMVLAFELSAQLGLCPKADARRLRAHLDAVGLPADAAGYGFTADALIAHMHHDKKVRGGQITFILAHGIGEAVIAPDVDLGVVERLLTRTLAAHRVG
ncbi:MAG: 3-dehydroquinate synthase [Alphaproteobacteria bacterium]|nr:3-dehydroquinate synthase [Alphaproteobacteria bacterium]